MRFQVVTRYALSSFRALATNLAIDPSRTSAAREPRFHASPAGLPSFAVQSVSTHDSTLIPRARAAPSPWSL